jgi:hypothetical protein
VAVGHARSLDNVWMVVCWFSQEFKPSVKAMCTPWPNHFNLS